MSWASQWSLSFWLSHQCPKHIPLRPHSCYMPCPSHPPWLVHSNYTWRRVQVMNLLIKGPVNPIRNPNPVSGELIRDSVMSNWLGLR
jgi:hypothetical protein